MYIYTFGGSDFGLGVCDIFALKRKLACIASSTNIVHEYLSSSSSPPTFDSCLCCTLNIVATLACKCTWYEPKPAANPKYKIRLQILDNCNEDNYM